MATRKPTKAADAAESPTEARALVDLPEFGVQAGQLLQSDPETVDALAAMGRVDAHPDAVAYAKTPD